ncbi:isochorismatase family protein [Faucicola mancuniensis]|uniref:isochorismatase family protein n=1 Tax=Faucicola mancuniensis TaxID=1309795 RepID=UPI0039774939
MQKGGGRNNPNAETICGDILAKFRELSLPIFHIRHASTTPQSRLHPTHDGFAFHDNVLPKDGEPVITKNVNSGFIGTDLHEQLQNKGINRQIFDAELIHQTALASLNNEFASVINSKHLFESFK